MPQFDALNYPYIRIRDVNWLKRTLLVFPHVVRISPSWGAPADSGEVARYCNAMTSKGPLLRNARLDARHVAEVQRELIEKIRKRLDEDPYFAQRYGRPRAHLTDYECRTKDVVWDDRLTNRSFQLHARKLIEELGRFLLKTHLAWRPERSHGDGYIEMHPQLGHAVMATLAYACAENEGLQVVTEFPDVHGLVIEQPASRAFEACLEESEPVKSTLASRLAQIIVYQRCDPEKLNPEDFLALHRERDALDAFKSAIEEAALSIPLDIRDEAILVDRLNTEVNGIFDRWRADQKNMSLSVRSMFGDNPLEEPSKLIAKLAEAAFGHESVGTLVGGLTTHTLLGAAGGFAVGLALRAANSTLKNHSESKQAPLRYLTMMHKSGVGFALTR